jgi:hypothetical protein
MLYQGQKVFKITAAGTKNVLDTTGYFVAVIVSVATAGTMSITIQDKATTPNKLMAALNLTPPAPDTGILVSNWTAPQPVRMEGGIDIVAAGTGEVYAWVFYLFEPEPT